MLLSELKLGQEAEVLRFANIGPACRQKFFACGLVPGAKISIVRVAPMGDPMQIKLEGDIMLSIRMSEGKNVEVEPSL